MTLKPGRIDACILKSYGLRAKKVTVRLPRGPLINIFQETAIAFTTTCKQKNKVFTHFFKS